MSKKTGKKPVRQAQQKQSRLFERFHWMQRLTHLLLLISFALLGLTGLAQKFPLTGWAQFIVRLLGGIETARLIHHVCATMLMFLTIYHVLDIGYKLFVRRERMTMLPGLKDVKDAWQAFRYNLGLARQRPQMGRYTFEEKMEYWALVWGTIIMGITGFIMWNPIATTQFLPGQIIPAAKAAHGGEALLAVAAVILWHMYGVHLKRFNKSMWTGKLTEQEMLHEHPLELADIKAGIARRPLEAKTLRRRKMVYFPIAGLLAAAMLLSVYGFIGVENTAPSSPPEPTVVVYAPQTPTPGPVLESTEVVLTWNGSIGALFQARCSMCHGSMATAGLTFQTYADTMRGGNTGVVIIAGDPAGSLLIQKQAGMHQVVFSPEELELIQQWITVGAPE